MPPFFPFPASVLPSPPPKTYLYIVEGKRVSGKVRQRIVANLGRLEKLKKGALDKRTIQDPSCGHNQLH
ncbi:hypothetical protein TDIS_1667 [Thermosulfurimonas dismutans]|uniref:Uncharacterized protein n=1 Tax=Thermosulfurimonas dismutans TaxID=999894 RepID=A0A179D4A6_9BACT|nr:hypothetical protein TDIS_1667 [Thermosulfurimonas dismutans]